MRPRTRTVVARVVPLVAAAFLSLLLALAARAGLVVPLGSVGSIPLAWVVPVAAPPMFWHAWRCGDPARGRRLGRDAIRQHRL